MLLKVVVIVALTGTGRISAHGHATVKPAPIS